MLATEKSPSLSSRTSSRNSGASPRSSFHRWWWSGARAAKSRACWRRWSGEISCLEATTSARGGRSSCSWFRRRGKATVARKSGGSSCTGLISVSSTSLRSGVKLRQ